MSRETKIGIAVAGCFVSLLGGVLVVKYLQRPKDGSKGETDNPIVAADWADQESVASVVRYCLDWGIISQDVSGKLAIAAAGPRALPRTEPMIPGTPNSGSSITMPGNPSMVIEPNSNSREKLRPGGPVLDPVPLTIPDSTTKPSTPELVIPVSGGDGGKPMPDSKDKKAELTVPGLQIGPGTVPDKSKPAENVAGGLVIPGASTPTPRQPEPVAIPEPSPVPRKSSEPGMTFPVQSGAPAWVELPDIATPSTSKPEFIAPPSPLPAAAVTFGPTNSAAQPSAVVPLPGTDQRGNATTIQVPAAISEPPPKRPFETPAPVPDSTNAGPRPAEAPVHPGAVGATLGPPTTALDPRAARPTTESSAEPRLDSYEEEWYRCQAGDTLEKISEKFFYTAKYAQALRQYNLDRRYEKNLTQENAVMQERQIIRIPPARVLEMKYPAAVPGMKAPAGGRTMSAGSSSGFASSASFPSAGSASGERNEMSSAVEYRVPRGNMTLRDIAKEQFGNTDQWRKIFLLNRWLNPTEPIPEGTMIFLPRSESPARP
jgi:hypothetical protein